MLTCWGTVSFWRMTLLNGVNIETFINIDMIFIAVKWCYFVYGFAAKTWNVGQPDGNRDRVQHAENTVWCWRWCASFGHPLCEAEYPHWSFRQADRRIWAAAAVCQEHSCGNTHSIWTGNFGGLLYDHEYYNCLGRNVVLSGRRVSTW